MSQAKRRPLFLAARQAVLIAAVTFVLAEIALRAYHHFAPSFILSKPSYNRFRGTPGALVWDHRLNTGGFNDVEHPLTKPPGAYRIVALGDSFNFGSVPYRHNYLTLLEERLSGSRKVELINMGISGTGPQDYLAVLQDEGLRFGPDMVLVSFFVGNDFTDTKRARRRSPLQSSAVFRLLKFVVDLSVKHAGPPAHGDYRDDRPTWSDATFLGMQAERSRIYLQGAEESRIYADSVDYLVRIKSLCALHGTPMVVLVIPDELQINPSLQTAVLAGLEADRDRYDFARPNRFLGERLRMNRIESLDLLQPFTGAAKRTRLYKPNDSHWNIAGNALAADLLSDFLAARMAPAEAASR